MSVQPTQEETELEKIGMVVLLNHIVHNAMYSYEDFHDYVKFYFSKLDPKMWQQYLEFRCKYALLFTEEAE